MRWFKVCFIIVFLSLSACSGSGTKYSSNFSEIVEKDANSRKVYVLRDTGFIGGARLFGVTLNSKTIGRIGDGEIISGQAVSGDNYLAASMGGVNLGLESTQIRFKSEDKADKFFVLGIKPGFWTNKLVWNTVDEQSFKYRATQ